MRPHQCPRGATDSASASEAGNPSSILGGGTIFHREHSMRAPFQILVIPYRMDTGGEPQYALFKRSDMDCWQFIAGGGEDDETALEAAKRESFEEAGIAPECEFTRLQTESMIPASVFSGHNWPKGVIEIPEFCFAVQLFDPSLTLSDEHLEFKWVAFEEALNLLKFESNRKGLSELHFLLVTRLA